MKIHVGARDVTFVGVVALVLWVASALPALCQPVTAVPFNRFYLEYPQDAQVHFYSTGKDVPEHWRFEGIEGYVSPTPRPYTVPLRRLFNKKSLDHLYTTSTVEADNAAANGFNREGFAGHVVPADRDIPGTVPLYRFARPPHSTYDERYGLIQDHFYSLSPAVPAKYVAEGVCCRVWKAPVELPDSLLRVSNPVPGSRWDKGSTQQIRWMIWNGSGVIRLSYSANGGESWSQISDVRMPLHEGVMADASYSWQLPPSLTGTIVLKLDWAAAPGATPIPWASVRIPNITIRLAVLREPIRK